ncbi:Phosphatidylcholine-sterol acyltransferase [Smittium mucronatum]|uniref:Phosphatidylcholine-sterol acyltransferase n=1 Tax=Smittium mucronatum TaxID=133383 RepID=A0A1R0H581_9FUNG|nr:Phosphatidylcholine-sterol acyltransferase [Smittium mucronatum]
MKKIFGLVVTLFLFSGDIVLAEKKNLVVFGDSLSDTGNSKTDDKAIPYWKDRFADGPIWSEYAAHFLKRGLVTFAHGSAVTNTSIYEHLAQDASSRPSLVVQVDMYTRMLEDGILQVNPARDTAVIFVGSNDFAHIFNDTRASAIEKLSRVSEVARSIVRIADTLAKLGHRQIVVFNVPDLGSTPVASEFGRIASFIVRPIISNFNRALSTQINSLATTWEREYGQTRSFSIFDMYKFSQFVSTPRSLARLNITDGSHACHQSNHAATNVISSCSDPSSYMYFDLVHPSTKIHSWIGILAANLIARNFRPTNQTAFSENLFFGAFDTSQPHIPLPVSFPVHLSFPSITSREILKTIISYKPLENIQPQ